ncbi:uncharacterized protein UBRO_05972 [Ustilago bromivora]|uniref:OTU domain-containing protein n=2 Tax=Ustilago bromivora TaxID=307758 RepID=A0A1K0GTR4_9BASI|nr:uncharacterized protein UBRO_05972 [Ustilago bromivora]
MPKKGKKGSRPTAQHTEPSRRDIEASSGVANGDVVGQDGFDIAEELLAALDARDAQDCATSVSNHTRRSSIRKLFSSSSKSGEPCHSDAGLAKKKVSRQKQRKERKAAEMASIKQQVEEEAKRGWSQPDAAEVERLGISSMCCALGLSMYEIQPDGHCLYAAVADQLNLHQKVDRPTDYKATRQAAAKEMRTHPEQYKPFISDSDEQMAGIINPQAGTTNSEDAQDQHFQAYCHAVQNTAVWGGQPEILALSRAFRTPIHIVQAGVPVLKVGQEEFEDGRKPLFISYHRKMYGLGEHYNSLRPQLA